MEEEEEEEEQRVEGQTHGMEGVSPSQLHHYTELFFQFFLL